MGSSRATLGKCSSGLFSIRSGLSSVVERLLCEA